MGPEVISRIGRIGRIGPIRRISRTSPGAGVPGTVAAVSGQGYRPYSASGRSVSLPWTELIPGRRRGSGRRSPVRAGSRRWSLPRRRRAARGFRPIPRRRPERPGGRSVDGGSKAYDLVRPVKEWRGAGLFRWIGPVWRIAVPAVVAIAAAAAAFRGVGLRASADRFRGLDRGPRGGAIARELGEREGSFRRLL